MTQSSYSLATNFLSLYCACSPAEYHGILETFRGTNNWPRNKFVHKDAIKDELVIKQWSLVEVLGLAVAGAREAIRLKEDRERSPEKQDYLKVPQTLIQTEIEGILDYFLGQSLVITEADPYSTAALDTLMERLGAPRLIYPGPDEICHIISQTSDDHLFLNALPQSLHCHPPLGPH